MPSLDLLLQTLMLERDKQLAHFDALDTKAGVLLAFDGVLITLTRFIRLAFQWPGIGLASGSALFALLAFWPRKYPVLRPGELRKYLTFEAENTRLMLHDTIGEMITRGGRLLEVKARFLTVALILLLLAAITFGAGIIYSTSTTAGGRAHHGKEGPVASASATPSRPPFASATPSRSSTPSASAGGRVGHHIHRARRQAG
jgi:hypothetical protein